MKTSVAERQGSEGLSEGLLPVASGRLDRKKNVELAGVDRLEVT